MPTSSNIPTNWKEIDLAEQRTRNPFFERGDAVTSPLGLLPVISPCIPDEGDCVKGEEVWYLDEFSNCYRARVEEVREFVEASPLPLGKRIKDSPLFFYRQNAGGLFRMRRNLMNKIDHLQKIIHQSTKTICRLANETDKKNTNPVPSEFP